MAIVPRLYPLGDLLRALPWAITPPPHPLGDCPSAIGSARYALGDGLPTTASAIVPGRLSFDQAIRASVACVKMLAARKRRIERRTKMPKFDDKMFLVVFLLLDSVHCRGGGGLFLVELLVHFERLFQAFCVNAIAFSYILY
jgi:hypothetical protein